MAISVDTTYPLSYPWGVLKTAQVALGVISWIILIVFGGTAFHFMVAVLALLTSLVFLILYTLHIPDGMPTIPWVMVELGYCAVWTIGYLIGAIWLLFLSLLGMIAFIVTGVAYGFNAFLAFGQYRSGTTSFGGTTTTTTTTTTSGPMPPDMPQQQYP